MDAFIFPSPGIENFKLSKNDLKRCSSEQSILKQAQENKLLQKSYNVKCLTVRSE